MNSKEKLTEVLRIIEEHYGLDDKLRIDISNAILPIQDRIYICSYCGEEFTWEGGNERRGNIYYCEHDDGCENHICSSCLYEHGFIIEDMEQIYCIECLKKEGMV